MFKRDKPEFKSKLFTFYKNASCWINTSFVTVNYCNTMYCFRRYLVIYKYEGLISVLYHYKTINISMCIRWSNKIGELKIVKDLSDKKVYVS